MKNGRIDALSRDGVERAQADGPPIAFRIWKAGNNVTDHGPTSFSKRSAEMLLAEQAKRGNRYSMDVNHLSLDKEAPLENQRSVGFFSLAVRNGELWAVECEWTDREIQPGPNWKYFSPAYDVDPKTGEVISFLNCALTNNPATHRVTALATRRAEGKQMKWSDIKAALDGDDEDAKASAYAAIKAAFPDEEEDKPKDEKKDAADPKDEPKKDAADPKDEPKKDGADDADKKDAKASVEASLVAEQDARIRKLEKQLAERTAREDDAERKRLIASREMSDTLAKTLATKPVETVKEICAGLPAKPAKDLAAAEKIQATRGADQGDGEQRASRLPPDEAKELRYRMVGGEAETTPIRRDRNGIQFGVMTPAMAKAHVEKSTATKKDGVK